MRVSLKGCDAEQFSQLTGGKPEAFELQLAALRNLLEAGVSCHAAVMQEFAPEEKLGELKQRLLVINQSLVNKLELEHLIPFPHVVQELEKRSIRAKYRNIKTSVQENY